jgi:hypothetical protein
MVTSRAGGWMGDAGAAGSGEVKVAGAQAASNILKVKISNLVFMVIASVYSRSMTHSRLLKFLSAI